MNDQPAIKWLRRILSEHPALAVSAIYLLASLIGMMFSWAYLRQFGINVFRYAEVGDFLIASLKEPFTWALALLALLLVMMDNAWSRRVQSRGTSRYFGWYGSNSYRLVNYAGVLFLVGFFLYTYATLKYRSVLEGEGEPVRVTLSDGSVRNDVVLLDSTARFLFLYDVERNLVYIHPHENVVTIRKAAPEREPDSASGTD
jgi:hypothetical protein